MEQKIHDVLTVALKNSAYAGLELSQSVLEVGNYFNALTHRVKELEGKLKDAEDKDVDINVNMDAEVI